MTTALSIAPVRKTITVNVPQARAFEVFTAGIDRWWPKSHHLGSTPVVKAVIEPHAGGRWYNLHEDGAEITTGIFSVWDAPDRVVFSWDINANWKPDAAVGSEVEIRFIAEGPAVTRLELEHRKFEPLGAVDGERMRSGLDNGWLAILEDFKAVAES